jgi:CBS domain-containing protein
LIKGQLLAKDSAMKTISQFLDHSQRAIYSVSPDDTVREALEVMGLISIVDVVREMIAYQKSMIEQLQSYIAG